MRSSIICTSYEQIHYLSICEESKRKRGICSTIRQYQDYATYRLLLLMRAYVSMDGIVSVAEFIAAERTKRTKYDKDT